MKSCFVFHEIISYIPIDILGIIGYDSNITIPSKLV